MDTFLKPKSIFSIVNLSMSRNFDAESDNEKPPNSYATQSVLTNDLVDKLLDRLYNLGLKSKLKLAINETLEIAFEDENIRLNSELQTRAFELSTEAISDRIALEFAEELVKQIRVVVEDESGGTSDFDESRYSYDVPESTDLRKLVTKNKSPFNFKSKVLEDMAVKVSADGAAIQKSLGLSPEQLVGLATVSLYDIVFLCDDSGSMQIGERIPTLLKTLQGVADWATKLEPTGISLRFLNYQRDGNFDNLTTLDQIKDACHAVQPDGGTELCKALQRKILNRRILEKERIGLEKPLIVAIITDGEPTDDDPNCFREALLKSKKELGEDTTRYMIFQVGNTQESQRFMENIQDDPELEGLVYCSMESLDEMDSFLAKALLKKRRSKEQAHDPNTYKRYILDEFIKAVGAEWTNDL
ncbi:hypothetical protein Dda_7781 [Drechslerella dactyloides]|uniref:VWFA domain-containing protein n=1 Tax=Drechslerella dactyloides TaxID=74499 RepID=A0AAD6NHL6_DREDA|nr:hypothetical protein Dda_7781 [Drechslerella dactyloides]